MPWFLFQTPDCARQMTKLLSPRPPYIVMLEMTKIDRVPACARTYTHSAQAHTHARARTPTHTHNEGQFNKVPVNT